MKITIESTTRLVELDGVPARVWEGHTESGIPVIAFVTRLAVRDDHDTSQFDRELQECRAPSADVRMFPTRLVL